MRICDLTLEEITVGLQMRSLKNPDKIGTIVEIDYNDARYAWVLWNGDDKPYGGFYGNDCRCEVVNK